MTTKILIVDDEPRYVRLMEANLLSEGYLVLKAYDGQQAVNMVVDKSPDLVLLDVRMPVMDGFSACERIREFSNIPIIIVSAKDDPESKKQAMKAGATDYLTKPFNVDEFLGRIKSLASG